MPFLSLTIIRTNSYNEHQDHRRTSFSEDKPRTLSFTDHHQGSKHHNNDTERRKGQTKHSESHGLPPKPRTYSERTNSESDQMWVGNAVALLLSIASYPCYQYFYNSKSIMNYFKSWFSWWAWSNNNSTGQLSPNKVRKKRREQAQNLTKSILLCHSPLKALEWCLASSS